MGRALRLHENNAANNALKAVSAEWLRRQMYMVQAWEVPTHLNTKEMGDSTFRGGVGDS